MLSTNRPRCRQVLECASPLALSQRLAVAASTLKNEGAVDGKAAEGCRTPRRWREHACLLTFIAPSRVENLRFSVPMKCCVLCYTCVDGDRAGPCGGLVEARAKTGLSIPLLAPGPMRDLVERRDLPAGLLELDLDPGKLRSYLVRPDLSR
jgi:hypothetical protein